MNKEALARIKINKLLEDAGWRFFDTEEGRANIQLEPNVKLQQSDIDNMGENFEKTKNGFVDYLLENMLNRKLKYHLAYWFKKEELFIQEIESEGIKEIHDGRNKLFMLREDLIPLYFGGNKVRIAKMYFDDMEKKNCDVIIGYGNTRSNLCRVIANMANSKNIDCLIVCPSGEDGLYERTNNSTIVDMFGAEIPDTCKGVYDGTCQV